jgi:hypothetical protein
LEIWTVFSVFEVLATPAASAEFRIPRWSGLPLEVIAVRD